MKQCQSALQLKIGLTDGPEIETCRVIAVCSSARALFRQIRYGRARRTGIYENIFLRFELHDEARSETINLHLAAAGKEVWHSL